MVVDIVLVVLAVAGAVHGYRLGALVQVLSFGGFWLGLLLGVLVSAPVLGSMRPSPGRAALALALVLGPAVLLGTGGHLLGAWSNGVLRRHRLGPLDAGLGAVVSVVAVLLSAWLLANLVTSSRYPWFSSALERSHILRAVDDALPPVPSVFARVNTFLSGEGFPPVFADLSPPLAGAVTLPSAAAIAGAVRHAAGSTVKVLGEACGNVQEGSGFVAAPGLVVTNAHVVAGEATTDVEVGGAGYRATAVLFDPSFDLAVLRTAAPLGPPLQILAGEVGRGSQGAVLGYPENGPLAVSPAGVAARLTAEGRDIYGQGVVVRDVYQLEARVEPGNSGGPLLSLDGEVMGVVFSRSTVDPGVGYALTSPGVLSRVLEAERHSAPVGTGACTPGG